MPFRLEHITLAERVALGCTCLLYAGRYGLMTDLATELGVSRQFLYTVRGRAGAALARALAPGTPGRPGVDGRLPVDDAAVARAILVLSQVAHASVRGIQECLAEMLGVQRSVGAIEAVLLEAAERARALPLAPPGPVRAEADELFAAGRPVLAVVDRQSGAVLALVPAEQRDETSWGCTVLDVVARGTTLAGLTADGAEGLRAGARAAGLAEPALDHWHTLRDLGRTRQVLDNQAYRALGVADRGQRAAAAEAQRQQHGHRPGRGRPLKAATDPASVAAAAQGAAVAVQRADDTAVVLATVRECLRPLDPRTGSVRAPAAVAADLAAAAALLREVGGRALDAAALLEHRSAALVASQRGLHAALAGPRAVLDEPTVAFLAWSWQHRAALGLPDAALAWPTQPTAARWVWAALDAAGRTTGMAENLNSVLAPHRAAHKGLPAPVLAVFAVYRNRRVFPRGKRAGRSPLDLLGLPAPHWLDALGYGRVAAPAPREFPARSSHTVNTLAA
ncbi:MAG TPA: hypothetical protein VFW96_17610 [Thermomicrobiales bacterium]|nr:hypothetical protein [Thermomicrobiales bacterium]